MFGTSIQAACNTCIFAGTSPPLKTPRVAAATLQHLCCVNVPKTAILGLEMPSGKKRKKPLKTQCLQRLPRVELPGFEPGTLCLQSRCATSCAIAPNGGTRENAPHVGPGGLEPPTSSLSGMRSNHLSYGPDSIALDATDKENTLRGVLAQIDCHSACRCWSCACFAPNRGRSRACSRGLTARGISPAPVHCRRGVFSRV